MGVTVFIEGEEECGSPSLGRLLAVHRDRLAADVIVIADPDNFSVDVLALTLSLRGLVDCAVEDGTLEHGLHAGIWGGVVPDALIALIRLLATLHDEQGNVAVAGLYKAHAAAVDRDAQWVRTESGLRDRCDRSGLRGRAIGVPRGLGRRCRRHGYGRVDTVHRVVRGGVS